MLTKIKHFILLFFISATLVQAQDNPVHIKLSNKKVSACEYDLIFTASIDEPWHMYSLNKLADDGPNPTVFTFTKSKEYELVGKVKQGAPLKEFDKVFEMNVEYFKHTATFTQRIRILTDKKLSVKGKYEYQACTEEKCIFPPADNFEFALTGSSECLTTSENALISVGTETNQPSDSLTSIDSSQQATSTNTLVETNLQSDIVDVEKETENKAWWAIFLAGFLGGLTALLTPCVFPMIPMNVSFFTKQSKTKAQGIKNAFLFAISIIILYVALGLGVTLIFGAGALHSLSTNVWFNLAFFLLLLIFAMSFLGAFEITLPSSFVNKIDAKSDKGGYVGIFFMAFTLVLVSFFLHRTDYWNTLS